jgi:hypothetical protein
MLLRGVLGTSIEERMVSSEVVLGVAEDDCDSCLELSSLIVLESSEYKSSCD